ncbi:MAG: hypothetical protein DME26_07080 [Verrucomicrobia bacterium]|nr:MAG: hypothetical protein DME26_07080 [Verrucomicrobiota bacterium]
MRDAHPFIPFHLHLSDGRTVRIDNRDFVWVFKHRVNVAIPSGEGRPLDREERIALMHIVSAVESA